jgi:hypothetical protein
MKTKLQSVGMVSLMLLLLGGGQIKAGINSYTAFKTAVYHQADATQPVVVDAPNAYFFGVQFFADTTNDITSGVSFTNPINVSYSVDVSNLTYVAYNSDYFETETDMDAVFPGGLYTFSINVFSTNDVVSSGDLTLPTNELYSSSIPAFTGDTWTNLQSLDPGQPLTLNWNNFTPHSSITSAFVFVRILDVAANNFVFAENLLPPGTTSINLPASTLDFGVNYRIELVFSDRVDVQHAGFGGEAEATAGFDNLTYTYFTAIPLILNIAPAGTNVVLSWTNSASDYSLQCTHDLASGDWNTATNPTFVIGNQIVLTNAICGTNTFFRLQKSQ